MDVKVDPEDADLLALRWHVSHGYARRKVGYDADGRQSFETMHRVIAARMFGDIDGHQVDHRNGDRLDNRRANLRLATHTENTRNAAPRSGRYRGVSYFARTGRWQARIGRRHLGYFATESEAAAAYDAAAQAEYGEWARLNLRAIEARAG